MKLCSLHDGNSYAGKTATVFSQAPDYFKFEKI